MCQPGHPTRHQQPPITVMSEDMVMPRTVDIISARPQFPV